MLVEIITVRFNCIKHLIGSTGMQVFHVFSSSFAAPPIISRHHKDVGNAGEKYFQSLRYFTSGSGIFRILAEEERKLVQIKH